MASWRSSPNKQQGHSLQRELDALRWEIAQCAGAYAVELRVRERVGEFNAAASRLREQVAALEALCAQLGVAISSSLVAARGLADRFSQFESRMKMGHLETGDSALAEAVRQEVGVLAPTGDDLLRHILPPPPPACTRRREDPPNRTRADHSHHRGAGLSIP